MLRFLPVSLVALALLLPPAASADSPDNPKGADVWLARPDGSSARRVTRAGWFLSPTQADDGTILAQSGDRFMRMDRSGRTISTFDSVLTGIPATVNAAGP